MQIRMVELQKKSILFFNKKISKGANIRNRYNQVPHLFCSILICFFAPKRKKIVTKMSSAIIIICASRVKL